MLSALKDLKAWRQGMKKNEIALEDRLVDADEDDDVYESDGEGVDG